MNKILRFVTLSLSLIWCFGLTAQINKWRDIYEAKKKDTVYGIAKKYGITIQDLTAANPAMKASNYQLKKGETVFIPFATPQPTVKTTATTQPTPATTTNDITKRAIRIGVMLPLHDVDGDGKRMIEYYRGMLMACENLKTAGISTDIHAWNVPIDADIRQTLLDPAAATCDMIVGPLYTKHVKYLGDFCQNHNIKMVIPFSITGDEVTKNKQIFQVYQSVNKQTNDAIQAYLERFSGYHAVFIDCNDTTSQKGAFTFALRKQLESRNISHNITNLTSKEPMFAKAFSTTKPNIVILNTGRSPQLNVALAKIDGLKTVQPKLSISMFGYTEWLMYTKAYLDYFFKYDTYVPTVAYYNPLSPTTKSFEQQYFRNFGIEMQQAIPRFAITGYDHMQYFCRGLHQYGKTFSGNLGNNAYTPVQTPLLFNKVNNAGLQNNHFMLIHYKPNKMIESLSYNFVNKP